MRNIFTAIGLATWVAGVLDIGFALVAALFAKKSLLGVLTGVASGPFRDPALTQGVVGGVVGLAVHFAVTLAMVVVFVAAARWIGFLTKRPGLSGVLYGLILYGVMYWIVLPLRWPEAFPQTNPLVVVLTVLAHVTCVGVPIALITAHFVRPVPKPS